MKLSQQPVTQAEIKKMDEYGYFNKGGSVKKSRTGPHDYRMNKGGLLLSSVDNRKKK